MEHLTTLKTLHILATALLLLGALGLAIWTVRARRLGDGEAYGKLLRRPLVFVWLVMGLCLVSMPFTGWWLVHLVGWPLGQTWVLASSVIYTFGALAVWWLLVRLNRLRKAEVVGLRFTLALAVFSGVCFLSIAGLMGAKPV
ncbi:DUF2269 family protein [Pseudomonas sp. P1B16]|jgi:uncharacterized membrane protein|uniref:DUF2269 family protein n=1 Tax=Pseudomonas capeferrum TaxID=1495066 RepID=A0ABY7R901_9PSED|nr:MULTISPECIES: DUF2269 family protein [Pseudomonas]KEY86137.1 membrane protein [Pseudomonas capeferrum]KGI94044.1 membrane protein [Pseudomonas sp. H2]MBC3501204.1 DUF2269 domain-containing protein [Pseudomonas sp. SWRI59]MBC3508517.1 DUF2269 domain-containing protein [Pseudomonas sp. SWRI68]MCH7298472.1 DUF2269 domain-containing protein [Pseudomonas capeferrum]